MMPPTLTLMPVMTRGALAPGKRSGRRRRGAGVAAARRPRPARRCRRGEQPSARCVRGWFWWGMGVLLWVGEGGVLLCKVGGWFGDKCSAGQYSFAAGGQEPLLTISNSNRSCCRNLGCMPKCAPAEAAGRPSCQGWTTLKSPSEHSLLTGDSRRCACSAAAQAAAMRKRRRKRS